MSERRLGLALSNFSRDSFKLQTKGGRYIVPRRPKLLITPFFQDFFRFFPFSPGLLAVLPEFLASRR